MVDIFFLLSFFPCNASLITLMRCEGTLLVRMCSLFVNSLNLCRAWLSPTYRSSDSFEKRLCGRGSVEVFIPPLLTLLSGCLFSPRMLSGLLLMAALLPPWYPPLDPDSMFHPDTPINALSLYVRGLHTSFFIFFIKPSPLAARKPPFCSFFISVEQIDLAFSSGDQQFSVFLASCAWRTVRGTIFRSEYSPPLVEHIHIWPLDPSLDSQEPFHGPLNFVAELPPPLFPYLE